MKTLVILVAVVVLMGGLFLAGGAALEGIGNSLGLCGGFLLVAFVFWVPVALMVNSGVSDFN